MLKIRLTRVGRKNDPTFRVIVTDSHNGPKAGKAVEVLGSHNPVLKATTFNAERINYWIEHGAQVSGTVHNLLVRDGIIKGKKINVLPKKSPIVKEVEEGAETKEAEKTPEGEMADTKEEALKEEVAEDAPTEEAPKEAATPDEEVAETPAQEETPKEVEATPEEKKEA